MEELHWLAGLKSQLESCWMQFTAAVGLTSLLPAPLSSTVNKIFDGVFQTILE